jgi:hypothetical protein
VTSEPLCKSATLSEPAPTCPVQIRGVFCFVNLFCYFLFLFYSIKTFFCKVENLKSTKG